MKAQFPSICVLAASALLTITGPMLGSDMDDRIEASAKKSYVFKTYLKGDSIKTESKDGVVTLTGTVSQLSHKALAQDTVESLPGVKTVENDLMVVGGAPAEHSDGWLSLKVKTALLFHRNVSASATDVFVRDGVVSLRGEASSMAQKELTEEYAKDVDGIKEVKNEMTIASVTPIRSETISDKIDDASITAQVKSSLLSHRSTSMLKTRVTTNEGIVTVSGSAKNAAEKSLVTKLISDVHGVISVVNNMTVPTPVASN